MRNKFIRYGTIHKSSNNLNQIQINDHRYKTFLFAKRKASADIEPTSQFRKAIVGIFLSLSKKLYRIRRRSKKERQMNNKKSNLKLQNPTHKKS